MTTRLIINADDYGRSPEISRGIRDAHLHGIVSSSTCMMNMPSVKEDIQIALKETPFLGLGVHLVLTTGRPLLPVSKLSGLTDPDGNFLKQDDFFRQASGLDPIRIEAEWRAQIEAFIACAGTSPTHIDSHHHTSYCTPALFKKMLGLASEYSLPIRLPIAHRQNLNTAGDTEDPVDPITEFAPKILEEYQPKSPDAFFDSFYDKNATRAEFLRILSLFLPNTCFEIMSHPGYVDAAFARESGYNFQRMEELEILTDPAMRKEVEKRGIKLISFAQL